MSALELDDPDEFDPSVFDTRCVECGCYLDAPSPEWCLLCGGDLEPVES